MTTPAQDICRVGRSLFDRGLVFGRTGNLSVRTDDVVLVTPTGLSLGDLDADQLSFIDLDGRHVGGAKPSKEAFLHAAVYRSRPDAGAVVHTHSTHAVALSCRTDLDPADLLPPLTAYYAMRVGCLPLLPYHAPGDEALRGLAQQVARDHHAMLIAHHGPVVAGRTLAEATDALEELEQTAQLFLLLEGRPHRSLTSEQALALMDKTLGSRG